MVNLDYFYGSEGEQYRFYQIPAILLEDEEYKKISDTAKLLYGILLSRLALSKKKTGLKRRRTGYTFSITVMILLKKWANVLLRFLTQ